MIASRSQISGTWYNNHNWARQCSITAPDIFAASASVVLLEGSSHTEKFQAAVSGWFPNLWLLCQAEEFLVLPPENKNKHRQVMSLPWSFKDRWVSQLENWQSFLSVFKPPLARKNIVVDATVFQALRSWVVSLHNPRRRVSKHDAMRIRKQREQPWKDSCWIDPAPIINHQILIGDITTQQWHSSSSTALQCPHVAKPLRPSSQCSGVLELSLRAPKSVNCWYAAGGSCSILM